MKRPRGKRSLFIFGAYLTGRFMEKPKYCKEVLHMALTKEQQETRLKMHIGRAYRLYFREGKTPGEIAEALRRSVTQIEKWIERLKVYHANKSGENG